MSARRSQINLPPLAHVLLPSVVLSNSLRNNGTPDITPADLDHHIKQSMMSRNEDLEASQTQDEFKCEHITTTPNSAHDNKHRTEDNFSNIVLCGNEMSGKTTILTQFRLINGLNATIDLTDNIDHQSAMIYCVIECLNCLIDCSLELKQRYIKKYGIGSGSSGRDSNNGKNGVNSSKRLSGTRGKRSSKNNAKRKNSSEVETYFMSNAEITEYKEYVKICKYLNKGLSENKQNRFKQLKLEIGQNIDSWKVYLQSKKQFNKKLGKYVLTKKAIKHLNGKLNHYYNDIMCILNCKLIQYTVSKLYTCHSYTYHNIVYWLCDYRNNLERLFASCVKFKPNNNDLLYCHYHYYTQFTKNMFNNHNIIIYDTSNTSIAINNIENNANNGNNKILFVCSVSSYTETACQPAKHTNRLYESFNLFEELLISLENINTGNNSNKNCEIMLILTFYDELRFMLTHIPFDSQIKEYKGPNRDATSVVNYIVEQFENIYINHFVSKKSNAMKQNYNYKSVLQPIKLNYHLISSWDKEAVSRIWNQIK